MNINDYCLIIFGSILLIFECLSIWCPSLITSKEAIGILGEKRERYLWHHRINGWILGLILIIIGFCPDKDKIKLIPVLLILYSSVMICNKVNLGRFYAYHKKKNVSLSMSKEQKRRRIKCSKTFHAEEKHVEEKE